jgi:hypothetical protein
MRSISGRHQAHHVRRVGLGIAGLVGRAQIDEDMLVGKNHAELIAGHGAERGDQCGHGTSSSGVACVFPRPKPSIQWSGSALLSRLTATLSLRRFPQTGDAS